MNNKGTTIVEIMISVVLISIVLIFLFVLLSDLKNEDYLSNSNAMDSLNRTELIHLVENDFIEMDLKSVVADCNDSNSICLRFEYNDNIGVTRFKELIFKENEIIYDDEKWKFNSKIDLDSAEYCYKSDFNGYYLFNLTVPLKQDVTSYRKLSIDISYFSTKEVVLPSKIKVKNYEKGQIC